MKVHIISASPRLNSGFSVVAINIAKGLQKLGYEISYSGLQTSNTSEWNQGIEILPCIVGHVDDITQTVITIGRIKPDVVLVIIQMDMDFNEFAKIFPKTILYVPVEGKGMSDVMTNDLLSIKMNGGQVVAQCNYGKSEMELALAGLNIDRVYHGFDDSIFKPIDVSKKENITYCYYKTGVGKINTDPLELYENECYDCRFIHYSKCQHYKEEIVTVLKFIDGKWAEESIGITSLSGITKGKFVFGFVGQNLGVRKRIERLLKAFSIFIGQSKQLKDRVMMHLHCMPMSVGGINLIKVVQDLGIQNNVIFSYGSYRSSGWSEEAMNILYNTFDVNVSASSGEGTCVLPDTSILTLNKGVQKIKDIKIGDKILTHKGRFMRTSQVMKREYHGDMIKLISSKLRIPIVLTPEHRVLAIKTKLCEGKQGGQGRHKGAICLSNRACYYMKDGRQYKRCKYISGEEYYRKYKTEWIQAKDLEIGDLVTYPKPDEKEIDIEKIRILDYIDDFLNVTGDSYNDCGIQMDIFGEPVKKKIVMNNSYSIQYCKIPAEIELTEDLMRLFGYFIAEGDISGGRQIEFAFNKNEFDYIYDVEKLMKDIFGLDTEHIDNKKNKYGENVNAHILRYSNKVLSSMFMNMFCPKEYVTKKGKGSKANIVRIPSEFLNLPLNKLAQLIKGEWRGDGSKGTKGTKGYNITTTSKTLAYQLLYILSKFDILASIRIRKRDFPNENAYLIEVVGKDVDIFDNIIGEKHYFRENVHETRSRYIKGKKLYYVTIEDIDIEKYDGYVYNLEVEEDNSYVCPIIVHNCLPMIEGFAVGLPMIAPNCSSFTEFIGNDKDEGKNRGWLVNIESWQMIVDGSERALVSESDFALKMKLAYIEKDKMKVFSKNAIEFMKDYTWEKIVLKWDSLLRKMK